LKKQSTKSVSKKSKTSGKRRSPELKRKAKTKHTSSSRRRRAKDVALPPKRKAGPLRGKDGRFKARKGSLSVNHPKTKPSLPPQRKPGKKKHSAKPPKRIKRRAPPKGYKLARSERFVEPYERVGFTFRVEALAQLTTKYEGVSFDPAVFERRKPREEETALQVFHTPFAATQEQAFEYFTERVAIMRAYGDITFIEISLWKVSGSGPMKEKKWNLLETYDEPEDVIEDFGG